MASNRRTLVLNGEVAVETDDQSNRTMKLVRVCVTLALTLGAFNLLGLTDFLEHTQQLKWRLPGYDKYFFPTFVALAAPFAYLLLFFARKWRIGIGIVGGVIFLAPVQAVIALRLGNALDPMAWYTVYPELDFFGIILVQLTAAFFLLRPSLYWLTLLACLELVNFIHGKIFGAATPARLAEGLRPQSSKLHAKDSSG